MYNAEITIMPLKELLDPQGKAVEQSLHKLGFENVAQCRIGKFISLKIDANSVEEAKTIAEDACKKLLFNPVMEYFEIQIK